MKTAQHVGAAMVPRLPHSSAAIPVMRYGLCTCGTKRARLRCHCANFRHALKSFGHLNQDVSFRVHCCFCNNCCSFHNSTEPEYSCKHLNMIACPTEADVQVRSAYRKKGWAFTDPQGIEQCAQEGFSKALQEQAGEGCHMWGAISINKVGT